MEQKRSCPECGAWVDSAHQFCRGCGCELLPDDLLIEQMIHLNFDVSHGEQHRNKRIIVLLCFFGLFVIALIIPDFNRPPPSNRKKACCANMRVLEGSVDMWEMDQESAEYGYGADCDITSDSYWGQALVPNYVKKVPRCKKKGVYKYQYRSHSVWCSKHNTVEYPMDGSGVAPGP